MKQTIATHQDESPIPPTTARVCAHAVFAFVMVVLTSYFFHPALAQSVISLVRDEHREHAKAVQEYAREKEAEIQTQEQEILWFARAIYSETKQASEQTYIAWAIRNRVAARQYPDTYKKVVLQENQFSGLNRGDAHYKINTTHTRDSRSRGWDTALAIAETVYHANASQNMLPEHVWHFYSPYVVGEPNWATGKSAVKILYGKEGMRFAFYAGVK